MQRIRIGYNSVGVNGDYFWAIFCCFFWGAVSRRLRMRFVSYFHAAAARDQYEHFFAEKKEYFASKKGA